MYTPVLCSVSANDLLKDDLHQRRAPQSHGPWSWEYWIIYKGSDFFLLFCIIFWLLPSRLPPPVSKLDRRHTGRLRKRESSLTVEGEGGWGRSQIIHGEKAWFSVNHLIPYGIISYLMHVCKRQDYLYINHKATYFTTSVRWRFCCHFLHHDVFCKNVPVQNICFNYL